MSSRRAIAVLLAVGAATVILVVLMLSGHMGSRDPNDACSGHSGVARLDDGYIICRDGYAIRQAR